MASSLHPLSMVPAHGPRRGVIVVVVVVRFCHVVLCIFKIIISADNPLPGDACEVFFSVVMFQQAILVVLTASQVTPLTSQ